MLSIPVISDFRQTDIDAGGQGAPLTGLFHKYLNTITNKESNIFKPWRVC